MRLKRHVLTVALTVALTGALAHPASVPAAAAEVPLEQPLGPVLVLAHRGASYDAPEHTRPAYDRALRDGADFLECDLQLTRDEVPVCVHDTTVDRTTGRQHSGRVDGFTLAQLRAMDFGSWFNAANPSRAQASYAGQRIVTLEEQLACYLRRAPRSRFHLETKAPAEHDGRLEPALVEVLRRYRLLDTGDAQTSRVVVQSFDLDSLQTMAELAPKVPRAYLFAAPVDPAVVAGQLPDHVDIAAPAYPFLLAHPAFPSLVHDDGIEVHTYTVDDRSTMEHLLDLGVDGVFTNRPDVLREVVDARGTGTTAQDRGSYAPRRGCT